tara:strand:+ start:321 stop:1034 length:714 start_codon:yes stop_codon:yes gene_type:complete
MPFLGSKPIATGADGNFGSTITIGDGTAEDVMIKFDGNAVDYHIGLDDSTDKLTIGKGSTLGTTTSMSIDADGHILEPLQPACLAVSNSGALTNMGTSGASNIVYNTIPLDTELYDRNGDYDTSNYTFTAPVDGKYEVTGFCELQDLDSSQSGSGNGYNIIEVKSTDQISNTGQWFARDRYNVDLDYYTSWTMTIFALDAGDTIIMRAKHFKSADQCDFAADGTGPYNSWLSVRLIS